MPSKSFRPAPDLTTRDVQETLEREIVIGSCSKTKKRFTFHPWANEYRVYHEERMVDAGQAIEDLLDVYNDL